MQQGRLRHKTSRRSQSSPFDASPERARPPGAARLLVGIERDDRIAAALPRTSDFHADFGSVSVIALCEHVGKSCGVVGGVEVDIVIRNAIWKIRALHVIAPQSASDHIVAVVL